ncbi:alpha/beta hydrolase [Francisellaceae bacterium]|nr:alpha/beta hydrolase [Francisellaceae bacterium]
MKIYISSYVRAIAMAFIIIITPCYAVNDIKQKSVSIKIGDMKTAQSISYLESGSGAQTVVLLHGVMAQKEQWINFINIISANQYFQSITIIAPDLPGFGASTGFPISAYQPSDLSVKSELNQVTLLHAFIEKINKSKHINFAANSMGGLIASLYAVKYPNSVSTLVYIGSPSGITPMTTDVGKWFSENVNIFLPTTVDNFKSEIKLLVHDYQAILNQLTNDQIKQSIQGYAKNYKLYSNILSILNSKPYMYALNQPLNIKHPVQIYWGMDDHIFGNASSADKLKQNLIQSPSVEVFKVPNAGHVIMLEPETVLSKVISSYISFLAKYPVNN